MHLCHLGIFHSNEEVGMAIREWLLLQDSDFYGDVIFNSCQGGINAFMWSGIMLKSNGTSVK
jgi:hypothetical protein